MIPGALDSGGALGVLRHGFGIVPGSPAVTALPFTGVQVAVPDFPAPNPAGRVVAVDLDPAAAIEQLPIQTEVTQRIHGNKLRNEMERTGYFLTFFTQ